jgi:rod shape-determining protein MreC
VFAKTGRILKKAHYIAFGAIALLVLVLLRLPGSVSSRAKLAMGSLFVPLFGLSVSGQDLAGRAAILAQPKGRLAAEVERLRAENADLKLRLLQAENAFRENERLRALAGWAQSKQLKGKPAQVIARDPANWWRNISINLGRRDGVAPDMPVLTPDGLVGRVAETGETRSKVLLLGDPGCRVASLVQEGRQTVDSGIISGAASVTDVSLVDLSYLSRGSGVKPGQTVVTSGYGEVFPRGILIGHLVDFRPMEYGLYTDARVKLAVDLNRLEEVWVLMR